MEYERKLEKWKVMEDALETRALLLERIISFFGIKVRPFVFWHPLVLFLAQGLSIGLFASSLLLLILFLKGQIIDFNEALLWFLSAGIAGGTIEILKQHSLKKKCNLVKWEDF